MILAPVLRQRFFDSNNSPLAGGKLYTYAAGTTTPQATYTDQGGGTPNANPVVLDSSGYADVWLDPSLAYKFILKDSSDVQQWSKDNVSGASTTGIEGWNATSNYSAGAIVSDASGAGLLYVSLSDNNVGNALTNVTYWRMFGGKIRTVTANTTILVSDELVRSNSTSGSLTHTLPACSTTPIGKRITVKDMGTSTNTTSVRGSGTDQVDGAVTYATAISSASSITVENNGSSWDVVQGAQVPAGSITTAKVAAAGLGTAAYADGSVTQAKLAARATGTSVAAGGVAISASCGSVQLATNTLTDITNFSVTLVTTGRPVKIEVISDGSGDPQISSVQASGSALPEYAIIRDGSDLGVRMSGPAGGSVSASSLSYIDVTATAGSHTYKMQLRDRNGANTVSIFYSKLVAYEL